MKTVEDLMEAIEENFATGEHFYKSNFNGYPAICFYGAEIKEGCAPVDGYFKDDISALKYVYNAFCEYAKDKAGYTLHWRCKPEIRVAKIINGDQAEIYERGIEQEVKTVRMRLVLVSEREEKK